MTIIFRYKLPFTRPFLILILGFIFGFLSFTFFNSFHLLFYVNQKNFDCLNNNAYTSINNPIFHNKKNKDLLLLGIITAARFVDNRAYNIWKTWAQSVPGNLFFFVSANTTSNYDDEMPLVYLKGVDDVYPPQKKSFALMRWMYDNYLSDYQWFMRADDDLYVCNEKLEAFLRSLDANKAHMLGQAGLGKGGEYGQLSLGLNDNYCMGGPGIILSREALRLLGPHLEKCLLELMTNHEDVELGRCVRKYVGIACTWNYEMQTLFRNNQTNGSLSNAVITNDFRNIITLHPIKNPQLMKKVHLHSKTIELNALRNRKILLTTELTKSSQKFLSLLTAQKPSNRVFTIPLAAAIRLIHQITQSTHELKHWDYFSLNKILFCSNQVNCPRHTIDSNIRVAINQIIIQLFEKLNINSRQRGRILQFQNVQYGFLRVEPRFGVDYVLDIVLWFKKFRQPNRATLSVRRHAYIQQTFGPIETINNRELIKKYYLQSNNNVFNDTITMSKVVHIILALQGRSKTFKRFAQNLLNILFSKNHNVKIVIVLYKSLDEKENSMIAKSIENLANVLPIRVINMESSLSFSRGEALKRGVLSVPDNSLLFLADVDMLFTYETIERVRLNTISGFQVYFPVIFSEYNKKFWLFTSSKTFSNQTSEIEDYIHQNKDLIYNVDRGYFRSFGFGIVSIFKEDFLYVGGFNLTIKGWGFEDVDFFEKCIKSNLRILRAPDPSLIHVSHSIHCDSAEMPLQQYEMCIGTKAASLASQEFLSRQALINS